MKVLCAAGLALVAVWAMAGCAGSLEQKLVGQYNGEVSIAQSNSNDPMSKMAEGLANMFSQSMVLELKEDKTYKMTVMAIPVEGKWVVENAKLVLNTEKVMGLTPSELKQQNEKSSSSARFQESDLQKPMVFTVSDDAKTLTSESRNQGQLVFKRKE